MFVDRKQKSLNGNCFFVCFFKGSKMAEIYDAHLNTSLLGRVKNF